jgi:hypothetical protein
MIFLGGFLLLLGVILPFLMVTQVIPSTLPLNFLAHTISVLGMILGLFGVFSYASTTRK